MEVVDAWCTSRAAGADDEVAHLHAGRGGGAVRVDRPHEQAGPLGQADRRARSLAATSAGARPTPSVRRRGRLAAEQRVDARAEVGVGRQRHVEALAEAGGVERRARRPSSSTTGLPDEPRASGAVCSSVPVMRRPRGPRKHAVDAAHQPTVMRVPPVGGAGDRVDEAAGLGGRPRPTRTRGDVGGVDRERRRGRRRTSAATTAPWTARPSAKVDLGRAVAEVVGVGEHGALGDDDAAAPAALAADADDGGAGGGEDGAGRLGEGAS